MGIVVQEQWAKYLVSLVSWRLIYH